MPGYADRYDADPAPSSRKIMAAVEEEERSGTVDSHSHAISGTTGLQAALDAKAPLASPTFTGTPAAPTPAAADATTKIATTAYVQTELAAKPSSADIDIIDVVTQAAYDLLDPPVATTLYVIVG